MSEIDLQPMPRAPLYGALALVGISLALVAAVPLGLLSHPVSAEEQRVEAHMAMVQARDLRFLDSADGSVRVVDASGKAPDAVIAPGSNQGFIRGVLRGLARDRRMRHLDDGPPFRLALWRNGRLSLQDRATGRTIELDSFGADNRAAFARLLSPPAASPRMAAR